MDSLVKLINEEMNGSAESATINPTKASINLVQQFPIQLQEIIYHYSSVKGFHADYFATAILSAMSTCIGNTHVLHTNDGYKAKANLFSMIVGNPGVNKSTPLSDAFRPIMDKQDSLYEEYRTKLDHWQSLKKEERESIKEPKFIKPILSDATIEAVAVQLDSNKRGCCINVDELSGFVNSFQRYSKGSDEPFYLSLFNGNSTIVDRATKHSLYIKEPFLSIIGTIQPSVMNNLFSDKQASGFFDRWLICYIQNVKLTKVSTNKINSRYELKYKEVINNLLNIEYNGEPYSVFYSENAWPIVEEWLNEKIDEANNTDDETEQGINAKMRIYVHRIILILHLAEWACSSTKNGFTDVDTTFINDDVVKKGVSIAEYFLIQAKSIRSTDVGSSLTGWQRELYDALPNPIDYEKGFTTKMYLDYAINVCMAPERSATRFLADNTGKGKKLFTKLSHGVYSKNL